MLSGLKEASQYVSKQQATSGTFKGGSFAGEANCGGIGSACQCRTDAPSASFPIYLLLPLGHFHDVSIYVP